MTRTTRSAAAASAAIEAPAVKTDKKSTQFVTIGCKLGIARFELQLCQFRTVTEQTQAGPRDVKQGFRVGQTYIIRGISYPQGNVPKGFIKRPEILDGAAITRNVVPLDFWLEWKEQHKRSDFIVNKLIFAAEDEDELDALVDEMADTKCAFSPLDMPAKDTDPADARIPKPLHANVSPVATEKRPGA